MKRILLLPTLLISASILACDPTTPEATVQPGTEDAEEQILAQELRGLDRWAAGEPVGYAHAAAEDVTYFDDIAAADRIEGSEAWRAYLATLEIPPHQFEVLDPKVQVYGDTGILTLHFHGMDPEGEVVSRWKATSVYRLIDGEWRVVHAHWSLIKEPEPLATPES